MSSYSQTQNDFYSSRINPQSTFKNNFRTRQNQNKLWQPSQVSLNFVSPRVSFTREERFKLHSIYYPKNNDSEAQFLRNNKQRSEVDSIAKQISKRIDEEQKIELRIKRKISQHDNKIASLFNKNSKKKQFNMNFQIKQFKLDKKNQQITMRLTSSLSRRQSLLRDRHGGRSNLIFGEDEHLRHVVKDEIQKLSESSLSPGRGKHMGKTITFSKRLNLNLPHNYYPGVGTYQIKRYLQQLDLKDRKRAVTAAQKTHRAK